ncbi:hypothetical protein [Legionella israelensis]|uniref:Uncharacterized protein n=1 Tax=Legionella israelensis TaxID=454 RepID=A0A0W0VJC8_9GAMM|nr:hypothetical protein [Legionella israelensis]KTD20224.1 hypothetical protein Lisr_1808 [Legionella israelensis]QBS09011.1 hypothetical protein E4T55_03550 [Legionella israelensis]SCY39690.1 hypothetical protein SAMN02746069_02297 [Legionella israelensis DSM 19235]STX58716.1 Transposase [Legionella israelensis]
MFLRLKITKKQLHEEIQDFFVTARKYDFYAVSHDYFEENHKGHGRVEVRRYWISNALNTISKPERWCSLKNIGMVEAIKFLEHCIPATECSANKWILSRK